MYVSVPWLSNTLTSLNVQKLDSKPQLNRQANVNAGIMVHDVPGNNHMHRHET
jgi:hypothetical protein